MSGAADEPVDDATLWAGRLRPWPTADHERADERDDERAEIDETRMARRTASAEAPAADIPDDTVIAPRRVAPPVERTEPRPASRPTTRRDASGRIAAPADTPRSASVPTGAVRDTYRPRAAKPVVVARATPPRAVSGGGPAPDPEAVYRRERRGRTRLLIVGGLSALAAGSAVAGIVVILVIL